MIQCVDKISNDARPLDIHFGKCILDGKICFFVMVCDWNVLMKNTEVSHETSQAENTAVIYVDNCERGILAMRKNAVFLRKRVLI